MWLEVKTALIKVIMRRKLLISFVYNTEIYSRCFKNSSNWFSAMMVAISKDFFCWSGFQLLQFRNIVGHACNDRQKLRIAKNSGVETLVKSHLNFHISYDTEIYSRCIKNSSNWFSAMMVAISKVFFFVYLVFNSFNLEI